MAKESLYVEGFFGLMIGCAPKSWKSRILERYDNNLNLINKSPVAETKRLFAFLPPSMLDPEHKMPKFRQGKLAFFVFVLKVNLIGGQGILNILQQSPLCIYI
jgi:hypothetical protein